MDPLNGMTEAPPVIGDVAELRATDVTPLGDERFRYRIAVPRSWQHPDSLGHYVDLSTIPRPIGAFARDHQSMTITTTPLAMEVRLEEWLRTGVERSGWTVHDQRWQSTDHGPRLMMWMTRSRSVRCTVAFADGGRLIATHCLGTVCRRDELAGIAWYCALSLHMVRPVSDGQLEARHHVRLGEFGFELPWSWEAGTASLGTAHTKVDARLSDPRGGSAPAVLRVRVGGTSDRTTDERRCATLRCLHASGWVLARACEVPTHPWPAAPVGWEVRELAARSSAGDAVRLTLAHGHVGDVDAEVIVACDPQRPRCGMRAARGLELATQTLAPSAEEYPSTLLR